MGKILELVEMEMEKIETIGQTSRVLEIPTQSNGRRFVRNLEVILSPFPASCYPERPLMLATTTLLKDPPKDRTSPCLCAHLIPQYTIRTYHSQRVRLWRQALC